MSFLSKKLMATAATATASGSKNIADVFSTDLWTGNGGTKQITNGLDMSGKGGLTWIKFRNPSSDGITGEHHLFDTVRGATKRLRSNSDAPEQAQSTSLTAFNNDGFTLGSFDQVNSGYNSRQTYCAWSFLKAPKFFTIVQYTGTGANQTISHDLGGEVGAIFTKRTDSGVAVSNWAVQHRSTTNTDGLLYLNLNNNEATGFGTIWNGRATSTNFTLGTSTAANANGGTYIAYIFADNSSEDAENQMIKCGSWTGTGSVMEVNLGWPVQWVLGKRSDSSGSWEIFDMMRGNTVTGASDSKAARLEANVSDAEGTTSPSWCEPTGTGFRIKSSFHYASSRKWIYMAIRAPMMAEVTNSTDVFDLSVANGSSNSTLASNITTDTFMVGRSTTSNSSNGLYVFDRMSGNNRVRTDQSFSENAETGFAGFDVQTGVRTGSSDNGQNVWETGVSRYIKYFFKRSKAFYDVVCYNGTGSNQTLNHSLGVVPELMWFKRRNDSSNWVVYHKDGTVSQAVYLDDPIRQLSNQTANLQSVPTTTQFVVGTSNEVNGVSNGSGNYICFLFATLAGVSKVGSYTGNGTTQTIDCGFSSSSRFILIKRTDAAGNWYFWDSARGISAGNDPYQGLNLTNQPEIRNDDSVDPQSSGFIVNQVGASDINVSNATYIFYAIA